MARRRRMASPTPRRKRVWADQFFEDLGFAEGSLRSQDLLSDYVSSGGSTQGVTVARTIITAAWSINEAHTESGRISFGLIKGTTTLADQADPSTEPYADWAWNEFQWAGWQHGLVTADAPEFLKIDTRSSRKIDEIGETWWFILVGNDPVTASTFNLRAHARTLLLLP